MESTEPLSVCMLVTDLDAPTGGVQRNTRLLLNEFNKQGLNTYVCARNYSDLPADEVKDGTIYHRTRVWGTSRAINGVLYLIDTFVWLVSNRKLYDVVHCQQMFGPTMVAAIAGYVTKKPIVTRITLSGETGEAAAVKSMPLASARLRLIRRVARWIALTSEMKTELEALGVEPDKIRVIYNGTEIPEGAAYEPDTRSSVREALGLEYSQIAVFSGRLSQEKNVDVLLDAWAAVCKTFPDAHLLLLGEGGSYRNVVDELKAQTGRLALTDNVHFTGHVPNAKDYIIASDVFVLPSSAEGMSNSLVEAFACGAAIVATDIAANTEICEDGTNALLVPVGNPEVLADAVVRVLSSTELGADMGRASRAKAEGELSLDKMVGDYIDTYREVLDHE